MARAYYKVKRGMVFWYEPLPTPGKTCVQQGHRPWLVVSNDMGNISSPTCNIVPMTTEDKVPIPTHVPTYVRGNKNYILCEQAITIDQDSLKDYYCCMTEETMEKVDEALAIQFGIKPKVICQDFSTSNLVEKLEEMFEGIIKEKVKQQSQAVTYDDLQKSALKLGQMVENLVRGTNDSNPPITEMPAMDKTVVESKVESSPTCEEPREKTVLKSKFDTLKPKSPQSNKPSKTSETKRTKWTPESRCQFLRDCDTMSLEEVRQKWGFSSVNSVVSTRYNCRNILKEMGVDYTNEKAISGKTTDGC